MDLNRPVAVPYTQGNWEGELGSDLLRFVEGPNATVRVNVASIMSSENFYINGSMWEGILGLGYPRLSKVSRFWTSSSIALVICLPTAAAYNPSLINLPVIGLSSCKQKHTADYIRSLPQIIVIRGDWL